MIGRGQQAVAMIPQSPRDYRVQLSKPFYCPISLSFLPVLSCPQHCDRHNHLVWDTSSVFPLAVNITQPLKSVVTNMLQVCVWDFIATIEQTFRLHPRLSAHKTCFIFFQSAY